MESRYSYICKLATQISKTRNINTNQIVENTIPYNRTDIMYIVLSLLMNNGLLFQKKYFLLEVVLFTKNHLKLQGLFLI